MPPAPGPNEKNDATLSRLVAGAKAQGKILGASVAVLWVVHLVNVIAGHRLNSLGIHPRSLAGLWGILCAPFLHASWAHLFANTIPLLVLGWIVMLRRTRDLFAVGALSALTAGLGTWLIGGANTVHLGASGVLFGLLGYLLSRGVFERKLWSIVGSAVVLVLFSGVLRGLFPGAAGISWEGHLFGFLGGILAARLATQPSPALAGRARLPRGNKRIGAAPAERRIEEREPEAEVEDDLSSLRRRMRR
jgi:membrane associated rhomboid family serine protease